MIRPNSHVAAFRSRERFAVDFVVGAILLATAWIAPWTRSIAQPPQGIPQQEVKLLLLDGATASGKLVSLQPASILLEQGSDRKEVPTGDIRSMLFVQNQLGTPSATQLTLIDGTKLLGSELVGKANEWKWVSSNVSNITGLTAKSMRLLQLKNIQDSQLAAWNDAISDPSQNDALVVARPNGELTRVGGTILELKNGQIVFEFDDQKIEMPLERLQGAMWYQATNERVKRGIEVRTSDHSVWNVENLDPQMDGISVSTASGVKAKLKWNDVIEIRFGTANLRWVAELETLETTADRPVGWKFSVDKAKNAFLPRFVQATTGSPASSQTSEKDLLFSQPGTYVFRMPEGFTRLESRVQRNEVGDTRAPLTIEVWQDDAKLFGVSLGTDQEYVDVKAILEPEKRVRLVVASSSPSTTGTEVQWKQPRLLR